MSNIRIEDIKPGDEVQVANGDWYRVGHILSGGDNDYVYILPEPSAKLGTAILASLITAHKPAKAEPPVEWVTGEDFLESLTHDTNGDMDEICTRDELNHILTRKYGPPPVPRVYKGDDVVPEWVLRFCHTNTVWYSCFGGALNPGDIWLPQPKSPTNHEH